MLEPDPIKGVRPKDASKEKIDRVCNMEFARIPIVGYVSCGMPMLSEENIDKYIPMPVDFLRIPSTTYFLLRANGDSMINADIDDGDLVLVRESQQAQIGDIVVALTQDGETTLKRLAEDSEGVTMLHPENANYKHIYCEYISI